MNKIFRIPRLPNVGQMGLAKYKPWLQGKIGRIERRVSYALIHADIKKLAPVGTGWLVREIYDDSKWNKDAPPFKPQRWMYLNVRKACAVVAIRIGRGEGWGSPVLWRGSEDDFYTIRARKKAEYAKRRRKRARGAAAAGAQAAREK
jgi:hypothetical protein